MLQTEEVDDDYFTPVQNTSLSNIFGETSKRQVHSENESLKYTAPKQQDVTQKPDDSKLTQCIFACAVVGHEWFNDTYVTRGKLGLAIIKIHKTDTHNIVLYDSNKTTLSCALISIKLELTVNSNHILYYDNLGKCWCLYATEEEIKKIVELLKTFTITLKNNLETSPKVDSSSKPIIENLTKPKKINNVGSDTDSSTNRKTKSSILNRMAMMGHSVLPPQTNNTEKTSDSSDNNDSHIQTKMARHKPIKNIIKRNIEKNILLSEPQKIVEKQQRINVHNREHLSQQNSSYTIADGVLMPVQNSGLFNKSTNEFDFFVTEQRISNSELRINLNRLTDKVDHMAEKINILEHKDKNYPTNNFQMEILQKLILEYEQKIKVYEDYFKTNGISQVFLLTQKNSEVSGHTENEIKIMENKINQLEQAINDKDNEITRCQNEIQMLLDKVKQHPIIDKTNEDLLVKIAEQEQIISNKNEDLLQVSMKYEKLQNKSEANEQDKLKIVMNETYSIISDNFDTNESYQGGTIKKIIAGVLRKVTIDSLNFT